MSSTPIPAAFPSPGLPSGVSPSSPGALPISELLDKLRAIPDSRAQGQVRHPLGDVLLAALFAIIADCDDFISMGIFAQSQLDWLRQYVPLVHGAPSHDTFRNVFMMIKPSALSNSFSLY